MLAFTELRALFLACERETLRPLQDARRWLGGKPPTSVLRGEAERWERDVLAPFVRRCTFARLLLASHTRTRALGRRALWLALCS